MIKHVKPECSIESGCFRSIRNKGATVVHLPLQRKSRQQISLLTRVAMNTQGQEFRTLPCRSYHVQYYVLRFGAVLHATLAFCISTTLCCS